MYLSDILENQDFSQIVFVISAIEKITKSGRKYITGEVRDKSGSFRYNFWDVENKNIVLPKANSYFRFFGIMEKYQNNFQINLKKVAIVEESQINELDFKKSSDINLDELWKDLEKIIDSIKDDFLKYIAIELFVNNHILAKRFKMSPAAESVHGAWIGGLLEHSISVSKLADLVVDYYNKIYFEGKIDRDIVILGALVHDIGKIWEYDYSSPAIKTTKYGELLGHIYLSTNKINELAKKYKEENKDTNLEIDEKLLKLMHVILSHHGKLEFGAPVVPKIPEAIIIYHLDNIDAKLMNFLENVKSTTEEFTQRNFVHENAKLYNIFLNT